MVGKNSVSKSADNTNNEITPFNEDLFMKGFLKNIYLRPSCYHCAARQGKSGADISIADYWGIQLIHPEIDDDKGTGLILINTKQGANYFNSIANQIDSLTSNYNKAIIQNPCIVKSVKEPNRRQQFWQNYPISKIDCIEVICDLMTPSPIVVFAKRVALKIKKIIRL